MERTRRKTVKTTADDYVGWSDVDLDANLGDYTYMEQMSLIRMMKA